MRYDHLMTAGLLAALSTATHAADLRSDIDRSYPSLQMLYQTLHRHPELSNQELQTAKRLAAEARASGSRRQPPTTIRPWSSGWSPHSPLWAPDAEPAIKTGIMTLVTASVELFGKKGPSN